MTPEREAQMRDLFETLFPGNPSPHKASAWDGFLACARALEQFAVDAYDLGWLSCVEWSDRDDLAADMQSPAYLNLRRMRLEALAEQPNAAMSAALEEEKNANE